MFERGQASAEDLELFEPLKSSPQP